jgi:hypothetical protein
MKFTSFIFILLSLFLLQSCASTFYTEKNRTKNNSISIKSNFNDFTVSSKVNKSLNYNRTEQKLILEPLTRKNTNLTFSRLDCYDINIKVKRTPRIGAVLSDLPLSLYFGIPLIIDVFKPDFYKISKNHKNIELKFQKIDEYFNRRILEAINQSISSGLSLENEAQNNCEYARRKYLEENPDVKNANVDPWQHYNTFGKIEGRKWHTCEIKNNNYVLKTPPTQYEFQSIMILDSLLDENPSKIIQYTIETNKVNILKSFIYRDLYNIDFRWESYMTLNLNYRKYHNTKINTILDSTRIKIIEKEIYDLKENNDLIYYIDLFNGADSSFKVELSNIRKEIESVFLNNITKNYDFEKLSIIERKDTSAEQQRKYINLKIRLEKNLVAQLNSNYDPVLFEKTYSKISLSARKELDLIRKRVKDEEVFNKFKSQVREIENFVSFSRFEEALALISQIEVNQYASESPENISILKYKNIAIESFIKNKISEIIGDIKNRVQNKQLAIWQIEFDDIDALLNNYFLYRSNTKFGNKVRLEISYNKGRSLSIDAEPNDETKRISFSQSDLTKNQRNELISIRKKEVIRLEECKKLIQQEESRRENSNTSHDYNSGHSKDVLVLCTTVSGYNYVSYFKLTLYQDGSASMDIDGNILIGTWYERNGWVITKFKGLYLRIEKPIGENYYLESSGRMWHICS